MNPKTQEKISFANLGSFTEIAAAPEADRRGKRFLSGPLSLSSCEISVNRLPEGKGQGFTHKHRRNEEIYIVTGGLGRFHADGQTYDLREGSVIRLSPEVERTLEAMPGSILDFVCIQAPEGGMPYTFRDDGIPVSDQTPVRAPLPLPEPLKSFFASRKTPPKP